MTDRDAGTPPPARGLRPGCHVLGYVPITPRLYRRTFERLVGTARVVDDYGGVTVSGNL